MMHSSLTLYIWKSWNVSIAHFPRARLSLRQLEVGLEHTPKMSVFETILSTYWNTEKKNQCLGRSTNETGVSVNSSTSLHTFRTCHAMYVFPLLSTASVLKDWWYLFFEESWNIVDLNGRKFMAYNYAQHIICYNIGIVLTKWCHHLFANSIINYFGVIPSRPSGLTVNKLNG